MLEVPRRTYILIHPLNFAGDIEQGLKTESEGCLGLGEKRGVMLQQPCILSSRLAVNKIQRLYNNEPFMLHIWSLRGYS